MKKATLLLLFVLPLMLKAQENLDTSLSKRKLYYQVGVDATQFINKFLSFNSNSSTEGMHPFSLNTKLLYGRRANPKSLTGIRIGFGYTNAESLTNDGVSGTLTSTETDNMSISAGIERQHFLTKRWTIFYGADFVLMNEDLSVANSFDFGSGGKGTIITRTKMDTKGAGPIGGVQFNLNRFLNLGTSFALYYIKSTGYEETTGVGLDPSITFPPRVRINDRNMQFNLPSFLYFNVMF